MTGYRHALLLVLLLPLLAVAAGCREPVRTDAEQSRATHGSIIDLMELRRLTDPHYQQRAENCLRTLQESTRVLQSFQFRKADGLEGWVPEGDSGNWQLTGDVLRATVPQGHFRMTLEPEFDCSLVQRVQVRVRQLKGLTGGRVRLQWANGPGEPFTEDKCLGSPLRRYGWYHTYSIEVGDSPDWGRDKERLRLEFLLEEEGVEIDSITFEEGLSREQETMLQVEGGLEGALLVVNDETRPSMRIPPGDPCSIPVTLPAAGPPGSGDGPMLRFALGIARQGWIDGGNPVCFQVHLEGERSGRELLFEQTLDPAGDAYHRAWHDHQVSLARFAGERVQLTLSTEDKDHRGPEGTGAFAVWGHPLIHCPAPPPANVLVVLVDTVRADHLGGNGYPGRTTPHLDRWAGRGAAFTQVVSSSCWTAPAVASLFTGQHPYRHGVRTRYALELGEGEDTLAEQFRRGGYFTGAISDNMLIIPGNGYAQGFHTFLPHPWNRQERGARELTDKALQWLELNGSRPFFFYLHYMDPHASYTPEDPYDPGPPPMPGEIRDFVEQGECGGVTKRIRSDSSFRLSDKEQRRLIDLYDGEIAATDYHIARLLAWLERAGVLERTVVVFLADHGEAFGEHNVYSHAHTLHDEEVMVPLVIVPPAGMKLPRGVRHPGIVRMVDLAPTVLQLAGLDFDGEPAGRSLVPAMTLTEKPAEDMEAYSEKAPYARPDAPLQVESSLRSSSLKLIFSPALDQYRLFDLDGDPDEQLDVFAANDRAASAMMTRLDRYLTEAEEASSATAGHGDGLDAEQLQQLEALGYLDQ